MRHSVWLLMLSCCRNRAISIVLSASVPRQWVWQALWMAFLTGAGNFSKFIGTLRHKDVSFANARNRWQMWGISQHARNKRRFEKCCVCFLWGVVFCRSVADAVNFALWWDLQRGEVWYSGAGGYRQQNADGHQCHTHCWPAVHTCAHQVTQWSFVTFLFIYLYLYYILYIYKLFWKY